MDDKEHDEIYDTSIYIDYSDLPKERRKELYDEFVSSRPAEKRLTRFFFFIPLCFGIAVVLLLAAAIAAYFAEGPGALLFVAMGGVIVVLVCFVLITLRLDKIKEEHELRFIDWLKTEKRVIAVLKEKKKKNK